MAYRAFSSGPRLNPALMPTVPVVLDRSHPISLGVTGLWLPGRSPVNLGSAGGALVGTGAPPTSGVDEYGNDFTVAGNTVADTGLTASALGIPGSTNRTAFGIHTWFDQNQQLTIFGPNNRSGQQDFSIARKDYHSLLVNFWADDVVFPNVAFPGTKTNIRFVVTYSGLTVNLYYQATDLSGANFTPPTALSATKNGTANTADSNTFQLCDTYGEPTALIGLAGGTTWSPAQAYQWIAEPFAMLRPVVRRSFYAASTTTPPGDFTASLAEAAATASAQTASAAFIASTAETAATSSTVSGINKGTTTVAETATAASTQTASGAFIASLSETAAATDSTTAAMSATTTVSATAATSDIEAATGAFTGAISETATASDSFTGTATGDYAASLTESLAVTDSVTGVMSAAGSVSETAATADTLTNVSSGHYTATVGETCSVYDTITGAASATASVTETAAASDSFSILGAFVAAVADSPITAFDTLTASMSAVASFTEAAATSDAAYGGLSGDFVVSVAETASASDWITAVMNALSVVNETSGSTDRFYVVPTTVVSTADSRVAVAALDAALSQAGETIRLQRLARPPATGAASEVSCKALIRGYAPQDLVAGTGITQQDQKMILSPTEITDAGWPGFSQSRVPRNGDRVISNRGALTVQAAVGIYMQGALVRIEAQIRGS